MPTPVSLGSATGTAASPTMTGGVAIQNGDLVVITVNSANTVTSVTDNGGVGNTYTKATRQIGAGTGSGSAVDIWYCANAAAVASPTFTVNFSGSTSYVIFGCRIPGMTSTPLDFSGGTTQAVGPSVTTGTLAQANEVLIGATYDRTLVPTVSSGFTQLNTNNAGNANGDIEYKSVSATTSVVYQPGNLDTWYVTALVSFKVAPILPIIPFNLPMLGM